MLRYVVRRILLMIPTLIIISGLVYFIIDLPPGDCVTSQIDELLARGDADALTRADELRSLYGLDQPLWLRYFEWVGGIFRWDFGLSCQDTVPVSRNGSGQADGSEALPSIKAPRSSRALGSGMGTADSSALV